MKTRGFLGFVGASFLLFAVGSVLTIPAYAGTGSAPPAAPAAPAHHHPVTAADDLAAAGDDDPDHDDHDAAQLGFLGQRLDGARSP